MTVEHTLRHPLVQGYNGSRLEGYRHESDRLGGGRERWKLWLRSSHENGWIFKFHFVSKLGLRNYTMEGEFSFAFWKLKCIYVFVKQALGSLHSNHLIFANSLPINLRRAARQSNHSVYFAPLLQIRWDIRLRKLRDSDSGIVISLVVNRGIYKTRSRRRVSHMYPKLKAEARGLGEVVSNLGSGFGSKLWARISSPLVQCCGNERCKGQG